ncbi:MAG TPA: SsrA-binding protein SmpB [Candidatus Kaiserbacteria bacterium]|nr:SsrA-binding protein SmpB [Candidatus Kaiserbacteria bacterium]
MADLIRNKKATFNFEILETFEAGLELLGYEVKSLRKKRGSLEGSHVVVRGSEVFLVGATIPPYQPINTPKDYDTERTRKLLLNKKEINKLGGAESQRGLTIVPISVYNKGRNLKLKIAIARGKKKSDKRQVIKDRDSKKDIERQMKQDR